MTDNFLVTAEGMQDIQNTIDIVKRLAPNSGFQEGVTSNSGSNTQPIRGYLCQAVSAGQRALCAVTSYHPEFRSFKIDVAGIIFTENSSYPSRFQLRCYRNDSSGNVTTWFDTEILVVEGLQPNHIIYALIAGSQGVFNQQTMQGALGHPFQSNLLIDNDDLYPAPSAYNQGDLLDSKIGCWIISISRSVLPDGFDIDLLFSPDASDPVQLYGPAVATISEIVDMPTGEFQVVTDVMEVASPSPLRGGSKIAAVYFGDVGYGIISANVREYLLEQPNYPY